MKLLKQGVITSPKGFYGAGIHAGIKKEKKDLALIYSETKCNVAGVFTTNVVKAAPVLWDKDIVDNYKQANLIAINSGVANACTGALGDEYNERFAIKLADEFKVDKKDVLICSTGVIGKQLPIELIENKISDLKDDLDNSDNGGLNVANAILTTDTHSKTLGVEIMINGTPVIVAGCCKGSGMIHPNMATMLGFVTTDLSIEQSLLDKALKEVVQDTFNMISVDRDTSTNDTLLVMANGLAKNDPIINEDENYTKFKEALFFITKSLAKLIASDGEGATKLLEIQVHGASSKNSARVLSKSVCTSPLVKSAMFGNDANWGRILCSLGYSGESFDPYAVDVLISSSLGELTMVKDGMSNDYDEQKATSILSDKEVKIIINMNNGEFSATAWGCDLTYDYVKINADYRS